jgi:phosphate butyryltransferase
MPVASFDDLYRAADDARLMTPVAVAGAADPTVLAALRAACDRGWVQPIVAGREIDVRRTADACSVSVNGFEFLDTEEPASAAVAAVCSGRAKLLTKGQIATPALMRAILDPAAGLRTERVVCQIPLVELSAANRRFLMADTGICIQPTLRQKLDILQSAVELAHALGADCPRVALMAATESVMESMPETLEAEEVRRRWRAGEIPGCIVDGPLSFDLAFAADAADKKRVGGDVAGAADVMLFPNLLSANLTIKAIMYTADCRFGGVLCGARAPVAFMSRADTTTTRLNSLAIALRLASQRSRQMTEV